MPRIGLNIGSNLGNRLQIITDAAERIAQLLNSEVRLSHPYESKAWGYQSDNPFLNVAIETETKMPAEELLKALRSIEIALGSGEHRNADGSYVDRLVDIDIIYYGDSIISSDTLVTPHPRMEQREFVLVPLCELSPQWKHPISGLTAEEMLKNLQNAPKRTTIIPV